MKRGTYSNKVITEGRVLDVNALVTSIDSILNSCIRESTRARAEEPGLNAVLVHRVRWMYGRVTGSNSEDEVNYRAIGIREVDLRVEGGDLARLEQQRSEVIRRLVPTVA
jgi:hypothetical protein